MSSTRSSSTRSRVLAGISGLTLLLVLGGSACLPEGTVSCATDDDCRASVCTRDGECIAEDRLLSTRLFWTLCATPATTTSCEQFGVAALRISFLDNDTGDSVSYEPVLCSLGQIFFDRMSPRFDTVEAELLSPTWLLDRAVFPLQGGENIFEIDFVPQSPTGPSGCAMLRAP